MAITRKASDGAKAALRRCHGFRDFLLRGNVIDIAVGIIIGAAFKSVVDSLVKDIITPLIGVFGGMPDFSKATFRIRGSEFRYGEFINSIISFLIMALIVYFLVVVPATRLIRRVARKKEAEEDPCPFCLAPHKKLASVCPNCTRDLPESRAQIKQINVQDYRGESLAN